MNLYYINSNIFSVLLNIAPAIFGGAIMKSEEKVNHVHLIYKADKIKHQSGDYTNICVCTKAPHVQHQNYVGTQTSIYI